MAGIDLRTELQRAPALTRARRWTATLVASVLTTYALDLVATGAGLLLAASGLLMGIDYATALFLLFLTYVAWGAGLWSILQANWQLIQQTGTSTNLLSKAAHDIATRLNANVRWRRLATHAGYITTELAKEAPYYLGAAGAALFSDSISAIDAIIFLVGANIGAATYGFTLAYGMRIFVRRAAKGD